MSVFKCKMCGGTIEFEAGATVGVCDSCGTKQTLPKTADDTVANLFNRANNLRLKCEFDKASAIYEKIVEQDDSEAEAHWGIILCKYGIEYVDDPKTGKKIPTCHRTLFEAVTADADYQAAVDYSDAIQQALYESEAREIDRIQKDILSIVKNEKPFNVFICYKETDENGKRTQDSVIANDIYYQLTQEGFKVFYAAITLEDKLGREYEPYIFAALNSAKVMLVVGTNPFYFNSVWVRNEWSRYLALMKTDRSKLLIPCYRDMDAYELPEEFAHLQAQDMSKIGFINDVVRGIKKVLTADSGETAVKETVIVSSHELSNTVPLLERVFIFLEDGKWQDANIYCEKVLDIDPKNAEAYLGKLMAELQVKTRKQLADCAEPFDNSDNYSKIIRFGDEKLKVEMHGYINHISERNENKRLSDVYSRAVNAMDTAGSEKTYKDAADIFKKISGYKDADSLAEQCLEKAESLRKNIIYSKAQSNMTGERIDSYEEAIKLLDTIHGWRDSDKLLIACKQKIESIKAEKEAAICQIETKINDIQQQIDYLQEKLSKLGLVSFIGKKKISDSIKELNIQRTELVRKLPLKKQISYNSKTIYFGNYPSGCYLSNNIEWQVLDRKGDNILVISKYALDCVKYNTEKDSSWVNCGLRTWLNVTFLSKAFTIDEQSLIQMCVMPEYKSAGQSDADKIFILSIADKYFKNDEERKCCPTTYAVEHGGSTSASFRNGDLGTCIWWLRSLKPNASCTPIVYGDGTIDNNGRDVRADYICVRPAMWISLNT